MSQGHRAIFFDMGYTLVYFDPPQEIIAQEALKEIGIERSTGEIKAAFQEVWGDYYRDAAHATFPATEEYDRATQQMLSRRLLARLGPERYETEEHLLPTYSAAIESRFGQPGVIRPYPEVTAVLDALKGHGYRLGIVSNWSWNLRDRVEQAGLAGRGYFDVVWASAYAGCNKPHPNVFHQALAQLPEEGQAKRPAPTYGSLERDKKTTGQKDLGQPEGAARLSQERVLYVGDSYEHDVVGAMSAGWDAVLLDRSGSSADLMATGAPGYPVISDLWGLFDVLGIRTSR
jgi:FMN phosphatase YigB (HAD superfamily)